MFGLKFLCLGGAAQLVRQIARGAFRQSARGDQVTGRSKRLAVVALALGGVACGMLLLYTHHILFSTDG